MKSLLTITLLAVAPLFCLHAEQNGCGKCKRKRDELVAKADGQKVKHKKFQNKRRGMHVVGQFTIAEIAKEGKKSTIILSNGQQFNVRNRFAQKSAEWKAGDQVELSAGKHGHFAKIRHLTVNKTIFAKVRSEKKAEVEAAITQ